MTLNPPAHICGTLTQTNRKAMFERRVWLNRLPNDYNVRQIAKALGVSVDTVTSAVPGRFVRVPAAVAPMQRGYGVTLPPLPFDLPASDGSETAPRAGIMCPPRSDDRAAAAIAIIREMHAEWVAA